MRDVEDSSAPPNFLFYPRRLPSDPIIPASVSANPPRRGGTPPRTPSYFTRPLAPALIVNLDRTAPPPKSAPRSASASARPALRALCFRLGRASLERLNPI